MSGTSLSLSVTTLWELSQRLLRSQKTELLQSWNGHQAISSKSDDYITGQSRFHNPSYRQTDLIDESRKVLFPQFEIQD